MAKPKLDAGPKLSDDEQLILKILKVGALPGRELFRQMKANNCSKTLLVVESIYPLLHGLTQASLITGEYNPDRPPARNGHRRKIYALTDEGRNLIYQLTGEQPPADLDASVQSSPGEPGGIPASSPKAPSVLPSSLGNDDR